MSFQPAPYPTNNQAPIQAPPPPQHWQTQPPPPPPPAQQWPPQPQAQSQPAQSAPQQHWQPQLPQSNPAAPQQYQPSPPTSMQQSYQPTFQQPHQQSYQQPPRQQLAQQQQQPPIPSNQYMPPSPHYMPYQSQPPPMSTSAPRPMKLDHRAVPSTADLIKKEIESFRQSDPKQITFTAPATLPPLVTTLESAELKISLQDGGCARPCHMRSTIYQVPVTKDILDSSGLEFSVVVKPFDDAEVDGRFYVPLSMSEIVRCNRCKAYVNPFSRNGTCCICNFSGQGIQEPDQRPELNLGSYEFRVSPEYYRDQIAESRRPHIIFAIEVTANSRNLVHYISKNLANVIKSHFPTDFLYSASLSPLVGFVTYNSKITIYDVKNGGHAYVVSDVTTVSDCASTSKFLVDPNENFDAIEKFLASLPQLCSEQLDTEQQTVLGPVIEAALKTCLYDTSSYFREPHNQKVIPTGKMYILHSSLPTSGDDNTPGRLSTKRNIDDMKRQLGTESESKTLKPDGKYYSNLAQKCINDYATGIELFLFPPNPKVYLNVATIGDLAALTGTGIINKYHTSSLTNFIEDLKLSLKSTMGFDASMRVRTSTGISPVRYIGNFNNSLGANLEMAAVNTNSNFVVQMKYDDKIPENDLVVVQFAMIYTSICGERRVRVHNLALTACQTHQDLYKTACCDALMNVLVRDTIDKMRLGTLHPRAAKEQLVARIITILAAYRKYCSEGQTSSSQLILPEGLKLLPMYLCGALKCDAIDGGMEMYPDDKVIAQVNLLGALPSMSQATFYPRLYAVVACNADDENNEYGLTASLTRCLRVMIDEDPAQCYVLENGHYLFIYFANNEMGQSFQASVFGGRKDDQDLFWDYRDRNSNESKFLEELIEQIVSERRRALIISIIRQGRDKLENVFNSFLYEDKKRPDTSSLALRHDNLSYTEMLCFLHGEIRAKLAQ